MTYASPLKFFSTWWSQTSSNQIGIQMPPHSPCKFYKLVLGSYNTFASKFIPPPPPPPHTHTHTRARTHTLSHPVIILYPGEHLVAPPHYFADFSVFSRISWKFHGDAMQLNTYVHAPSTIRRANTLSRWWSCTHKSPTNTYSSSYHFDPFWQVHEFIHIFADNTLSAMLTADTH